MKKSSEIWTTSIPDRQTLDRYSRMIRIKREQRRLAQKASSSSKEATSSLYAILNRGRDKQKNKDSSWNRRSNLTLFRWLIIRTCRIIWRHCWRRCMIGLVLRSFWNFFILEPLETEFIRLRRSWIMRPWGLFKKVWIWWVLGYFFSCFFEGK